ncbi:MAG: hypothetical protein AB7E51_00245 [Pseudodesulfovibrio sp.]|uniref:hypothetical protein n=1 Tax=Pseudodesulfovibrio sp. TaxID=2035812 RepID=UPI003D10C573
MPLYEVVKPLKFRPESGKPMLTIKPGEPLDEELLDHWYVKAAIDDGRVRLLPDSSAKAKAESGPEAEAKAKDAKKTKEGK